MVGFSLYSGKSLPGALRVDRHLSPDMTPSMTHGKGRGDHSFTPLHCEGTRIGNRGSNRRKGTTPAGPAEIVPECTEAILNRRSPTSFDRCAFTMSRAHSPKKMGSVSSEGPWKSEHPFGPPHVPRSPPAGIQRLRNTLHKLSPAAFAEKELLRKKNQYKSPLTQRNVDNFVTEQECNEAYKPNLHSPEIQVNEWLQRVS
ncbi:unnamed protein product [Penicillium bialowiezense]